MHFHPTENRQKIDTALKMENYAVRLKEEGMQAGKDVAISCRDCRALNSPIGTYKVK